MMKRHPKIVSQSMRRINSPHITNRYLSPERKVSVTEKIRRILLPGNTQPVKRIRFITGLSPGNPQ